MLLDLFRILAALSRRRSGSGLRDFGFPSPAQTDLSFGSGFAGLGHLWPLLPPIGL
jgi:hypothetical protein